MTHDNCFILFSFFQFIFITQTHTHTYIHFGEQDHSNNGTSTYTEQPTTVTSSLLVRVCIISIEDMSEKRKKN